MNDLSTRLERLTPAHRRLLELRSRRRGQHVPTLSEPPPATGGMLPLTPEQEETWLRYRWTPETGYNYAVPLRLSGELDVSTLERALEELFGRHPALRAGIVVEDGRPFQRIGPAEPVRLPLVDLQHRTEADREAAALGYLGDFLDRRFERRADRLWRATLLRLRPQEHLLAMAFDELVCDARSRIILIEELLEIYEARRRGHPPRLSQLTLGYAEYIDQRRRWLRGDRAARCAAAWCAELEHARLLALPGDRPVGPERTFRGARLPYAVPARVIRGLQALNGREGTSLYMCLMAAFGALLSRYTGRTDVVFTTHVFNRLAPGSERLVGNFTTYLLPRCRWAGDPSFRELLIRARGVTLGAYSRKELPMSRVLPRLGWEDYSFRSPVSQFHLAVHYDNDLKGVEGGSLKTRFENVYLGRSSGDLGLFAYVSKDEVEVMIEYSLAIFDESTVLRFRDHLGIVLERAAAEPDQRLSALLSGIGSLLPGERP